MVYAVSDIVIADTFKNALMPPVAPVEEVPAEEVPEEDMEGTEGPDAENTEQNPAVK